MFVFLVGADEFLFAILFKIWYNNKRLFNHKLTTNMTYKIKTKKLILAGVGVLLAICMGLYAFSGRLDSKLFTGDIGAPSPLQVYYTPQNNRTFFPDVGESTTINYRVNLQDNVCISSITIMRMVIHCM